MLGLFCINLAKTEMGQKVLTNNFQQLCEYALDLLPDGWNLLHWARK